MKLKFLVSAITMTDLMIRIFYKDLVIKLIFCDAVNI